MSCENLQDLISSLVDRRVCPGERENVLAHIESCAECAARYEYMQSTRNVLRRMAEPPIPAHLREKLRLLASYERIRQLSHASFATRWQRCASRIQLAFENMMRPAALPFA